MLEAVRSGDIDVLVINQVYNLSRTTRHLAFLFNELTSQGVRIVSAADPSFDTETLIGGLLMRSLFAFAEIEQVGALEDLRVRRHLRRHSAEVPRLSGQP
jgi:DNA invertase Pin-like site-specific DNA recombinase